MSAKAKTQTTKEQLKQVCALIAREFQPERIILFGSHAYGNPTADSDFDLLIVMRFAGDPLEQAVTILKKLNLLLPIDLLVKTPEQVKQRLELGDRFMREIVERGKVLYEAAHA